MDAQVLLSAVFRDPTKEGRSQFVKIWFLTSNLPNWLLPDVKIVPITKGVVSHTFRRLPPRDLTLTLNIEKRTYQYLGGSGKAELKTLLQKVNDPGYTIHGHLVIVQLDGPASHTLDCLRAKCDIVPGPNSGNGIMLLKNEALACSLDRVKQRCNIDPEPETRNGTMQLYTRPTYPLDFLQPRYDRVPGPFSVESIIPRCGLIQGDTIIPFAKLLSHAVIKAPTGSTSINVSASSPEIKPELTPQTVDNVLTPDQSNQRPKLTSKLTKESTPKPTRVMSWLTWGMDILKRLTNNGHAN